jgi:hypothetical protein
LFLYYPLNGDVRWAWQATLGPETNGPAMAWYGIVATSVVIAILSAVGTPRSIAKALGPHVWIFPIGAMLVCAMVSK